jgi:hypothetical protein
MLLTARQAAARLADAGISRRRADVVLHAGVAGAPVRTPAAHLYDEAAVDALLARRWLDPLTVDRLFPHGVLVSRRVYDVLTTTPVEALADGWDFSTYTRVWIRHVLEAEPAFPLVATVCGFVVGAADIVGVRTGGRHASGLDLRPPGPWAAEVGDGWLPTGRGRDFSLRLPPGVRASEPVGG